MLPYSAQIIWELIIFSNASILRCTESEKSNPFKNNQTTMRIHAKQ